MLLGTEVTKVIFDDVYEAELEKGYALVTDELLDAARNLLSSALPEDASGDMTQAFWEKVYDYL